MPKGPTPFRRSHPERNALLVLTLAPWPSFMRLFDARLLRPLLVSCLLLALKRAPWNCLRRCDARLMWPLHES
jgi:hypothetical protein